VTLVNRSPDATEEASLVLRDYAFDGLASVTTLTAEDPSGQPGDPLPLAGASRLPGVRGAHLARSTAPGGARSAHGNVLALALPPRSFTVIEAPIVAPP
jgi:hypothetical protein